MDNIRAITAFKAHIIKKTNNVWATDGLNKQQRTVLVTVGVRKHEIVPTVDSRPTKKWFHSLTRTGKILHLVLEKQIWSNNGAEIVQKIETN